MVMVVSHGLNYAQSKKKNKKNNNKLCISRVCALEGINPLFVSWQSPPSPNPYLGEKVYQEWIRGCTSVDCHNSWTMHFSPTVVANIQLPKIATNYKILCVWFIALVCIIQNNEYVTNSEWWKLVLMSQVCCWRCHHYSQINGDKWVLSKLYMCSCSLFRICLPTFKFI